MARGQGGRGRQQPTRGFRPGKEPAQVRKQRAREQLGEASSAQKKLIDAIADRTPEQARKMMGRWRAGALALTIVLAAVSALLFRWSLLAGGIVAVLAIAAFVIWFRLWRQRASFDALVDIVSGGRRT